MKKILPLYLGASFIAPFLASTTFFVSFLLIFQMFRITNLVVNKGIPVTVVAELMSYIAASFLPMAIPLAVLFATIYTLNRISTDSEFIAMRSFGLSRFEIYRPILFLTVVIALVTFALNASLIPEAKRKFKEGVRLLTSKSLLAEIKPGDFFTDIPGITIFADKVEEKGKVLKKIFIRADLGKEKRVIFADTGIIEKLGGGAKFGATGLRMHLKDGSILKYFRESKNVEKVVFEDYKFPVEAGKFSSGGAQKDSERTSRELFQLMQESEERSQKDRNRTKLEFWSRINTPFLCLLFSFIGFCLGVQRVRGKSINSASMCILILAIYYSVYFLGLSLAKNNKIAAELAVFLPTLIGFFVGQRLFKRLLWVN